MDPLSLRRFSVRDLEAMVQNGILAEDERIELLDGQLLVMSPQSPEHAALTEVIRALLLDAFAPGVCARTHAPLFAGEFHLPEPDVAILRGSPGDYLHRHPGASDVVLLVEVAHSSHARDRDKGNLYASIGVPEYWIVDIPGRRVEVRRDPEAPRGYQTTKILSENDEIALGDRTIAVRALLP